MHREPCCNLAVADAAATAKFRISCADIDKAVRVRLRFATLQRMSKSGMCYFMNQMDKPIANPIVVLREEFDDWAILFNPDTADAMGTNPVGVAVWKRMDGKRSIEDIVSEIRNSFTDTPEAVFKEIVTFINTLEEKGFAGLEVERK